MSDFELEIIELKKKIEELENKKDIKPSYKYSKIKDSDLRNLVDIKRSLNDDFLNTWLNNSIKIDNPVVDFLDDLIKENKKLIKSYKEEDLKIKFITPILNKIKFLSYENEFREFYEEPLVYETDKFILNGTTDFLVSKGLFYSEKPFFFIQEFKRGKSNSDPEPQLLAELISAVELNNWKTIKGAYLIGAHWNFVILERLSKHKYQYFVSRDYDSTRLDDLIDIYKNLLFVKEEIIRMIESEV